MNNLFNGENKLLADTVNKFLNDHSQEVIKEVIIDYKNIQIKNLITGKACNISPIVSTCDKSHE